MHSVIDQVKLLLIALQFYTRIPVTGNLAQWSDYSPARLSISTRYFTLVGIVVGAMSAATYWIAHLFFQNAIAVVLSVAIGVLITGAFHEDGWADFCDAFGGYNNRSKTLEIMTDSRIGSYGAIGLALLLLLKVLTLNSLSPVATVTAMLVIHPLSRAFACCIMITLPYAKPEDASKAKPIAQDLAKKDIAIAIGVALGIAAMVLFFTIRAGELRPINSLLALVFMALAWWRLRSLMKTRLQGYTGDTLGATQQLTECVGYVGLALL
jgi:adenosylcobinamide-GDP ribazoletransferase